MKTEKCKSRALHIIDGSAIYTLMALQKIINIGSNIKDLDETNAIVKTDSNFGARLESCFDFYFKSRKKIQSCISCI
jgi:hypothetical protein